MRFWHSSPPPRALRTSAQARRHSRRLSPFLHRRPLFLRRPLCPRPRRYPLFRGRHPHRQLRYLRLPRRDPSRCRFRYRFRYRGKLPRATGGAHDARGSHARLLLARCRNEMFLRVRFSSSACRLCASRSSRSSGVNRGDHSQLIPASRNLRRDAGTNALSGEVCRRGPPSHALV